MIRITVTLHGAISGKTRVLGIMDIGNAGGTEMRGNYNGRVYRCGSKRAIMREGNITNYPRRSYNVWRLVLRMLRECFPEEK